LQSSLPKPALYSRPGGVVSIPGPALQEFLRAILKRGVSFRFQARGSSMQPFIRDGDVVTVSPGPVGEMRLGDVVAFCHPNTGRLVVHRLVGRRPGGYLLRGDNALEEDGLIPPEKVLGLVTQVERRGRKVRLGQGPERRLLAWLARRDLLKPIIFRAWQVLHPFARRSPA
jgi:signal peptidase I